MANVSVIIPTHNRIDFLKEALESVINQTLGVSEIILISDGSDDSTSREIVSLSKLDHRIHYFENESNKGAAYSRNLGAKESNGDYLCFLDDDILCPDFLESAVSSLESDQSIDAVFGDSVIHPASDNSYQGRVVELLLNKSKSFYDDHGKVDVGYIMTFCPMINSLLLKKELFNEHRFDEDLRYGEDILLWLQVVSSGKRFKKLDSIASKVRIHKGAGEYSFEDHQKFYNRVEEKGLLTSAKEKHLHLMRRTFSELNFGRLPSIKRVVDLLYYPADFLKYLWMNLLVRLSARLS